MCQNTSGFSAVGLSLETPKKHLNMSSTVYGGLLWCHNFSSGLIKIIFNLIWGSKLNACLCMLRVCIICVCVCVFYVCVCVYCMCVCVFYVHVCCSPFRGTPKNSLLEMSTTVQRSRLRTSTWPAASRSPPSGCVDCSSLRPSRCVWVDDTQMSTVLCSPGPVSAKHKQIRHHTAISGFF